VTLHADIAPIKRAQELLNSRSLIVEFVDPCAR
jgi:hypothetical protein